MNRLTNGITKIVLSTSLFLFYALTCAQAQMTKQPLSYDFGESGCGTCEWFVVVDGVMGGLSTGELISKTETIELKGSISLANNGGFSSIRTPYQDFDLSPYREVSVRYRSSEQDFAITLNPYRRYWKPRFKAILPVTDSQWREMSIPFSDFKKMRFDDVLGDGPTQKELTKIIRLGLISSSKKEGEFSIELDYIRLQ